MSVNKYNSTTGNLERLDGYTVDSTPTSGSGNPVSSGGVFTALANRPKIAYFKHWIGTGIKSDGSTQIPFSTFTSQISDFNELINIIVNLGTMMKSNNVDISVEKYENRNFIRLVARSAADEQNGYINVTVIYK